MDMVAHLAPPRYPRHPDAGCRLTGLDFFWSLPHTPGSSSNLYKKSIGTMLQLIRQLDAGVVNAAGLGLCLAGQHEMELDS